MAKTRRLATLVWLACVGVAGSAAGQDRTPRFAHPGRVVDAQGEPIANAAVTFVSAPRLGASADDDEVVHTTSGADGRFRVELVATRSYRAWATQQLDGKVSASDLMRVQSASTELRVLAGPALATRGSLENAAEWQEHGELKLQFVVAGSGFAVPTVGIAADGTFALPPMPHGEVMVRLFCREQLVHVWPRWSRENLRAPKPWQLSVRVLDAQGAPIAGALVARLDASQPMVGELFDAMQQLESWPLAEVGDDGRATILYSDSRLRTGLAGRDLQLLAIVPGQDTIPPGALRAGELTFTIPAAAVPIGKIHHAPPGCTVRFCGQDAPGLPSGSVSVACTVDADGSIPVPSTNPAAAIARGRVMRGIPTDPTPALLGGWQPKLAANDVFLRVATAQPVLIDSGELIGEGGVDCDQLIALRIQVLDATGGPAAAAAVSCLPRIHQYFAAPQYAPRQTADTSGRVLIGTLPRECFVFAEQPRAFTFAIVDVRPGAAISTLQLQPFARMLVRVIDAKGAAVAGATVSSRAPPGLMSGDAVEQVLQAIALREDRQQKVATDQHGLAELWFVPCPGLQRCLNVGNPGLLQTSVALRPSDTPVEIVAQ